MYGVLAFTSFEYQGSIDFYCHNPYKKRQRKITTNPSKRALWGSIVSSVRYWKNRPHIYIYMHIVRIILRTESKNLKHWQAKCLVCGPAMVTDCWKRSRLLGLKRNCGLRYWPQFGWDWFTTVKTCQILPENVLFLWLTTSLRRKSNVYLSRYSHR